MVHASGALSFNSRRSPNFSQRGMVSCSQPLAAVAGVRILQAGGNAADAAVAVAACLNVTEPCSTGIGGDAFCLYFDAATHEVSAMNGSGRSPAALSLAVLEAKGLADRADPAFPATHAHNVTVPGAAAAWCDAVAKFGSGKLSMAEVLAPGIALAEDGHPVSFTTAWHWQNAEKLLQTQPGGEQLLQPGGAAPKAGELFKNPNLGKTFRALAENGKAGFYGADSDIAAAIVAGVKAGLGGDERGAIERSDLERHTTDFDAPISVMYKGVEVWEHPPNGQGITALIALNILEGAYPAGLCADCWHPDAYLLLLWHWCPCLC